MANYDIDVNWQHLSSGEKARVINLASNEELTKWASDPDCNQKLLCATALGNIAKLAEPPFHPRTEVSEDARYIAGHIVKHLWIIFVALPFVLALLFAILKGL